MNNPVFCKSEFKLCNVEVPKGYPQSQTHVGIAYYNNRYYLTCSPYPAKKYSLLEYYGLSILRTISFGRFGKMIDAEKYENPMLYQGNCEEGKPPLLFSPILPFPLMDVPEPIYGLPAYNSDPDIFIENGNVYILNRTYYRKPSLDGVILREVVISLIEGVVDSKGYHVRDIMEFKRSSESLISPCLIKYKDRYLFTSLETNSANDGQTFDGLYMQQSDTLIGLKREKGKTKVKIEGTVMLPWHMSLFTYQDELYAIVACVCRGDKTRIWQMLGVFDQELSVLKLFPKPLTDYNSYRGAATVVDGYFILYTTTLNERIPGSTSVDGRNIIVTRRLMSDVLAIVREL